MFPVGLIQMMHFCKKKWHHTLRMPLDSFITIREMSLDQLGKVMLAGFLRCKELLFCHSALSETTYMLLLNLSPMDSITQQNILTPNENLSSTWFTNHQRSARRLGVECLLLVLRAHWG